MDKYQEELKMAMLNSSHWREVKKEVNFCMEEILQMIKKSNVDYNKCRLAIIFDEDSRYYNIILYTSKDDSVTKKGMIWHDAKCQIKEPLFKRIILDVIGHLDANLQKSGFVNLRTSYLKKIQPNSRMKMFRKNIRARKKLFCSIVFQKQKKQNLKKHSQQPPYY